MTKQKVCPGCDQRVRRWESIDVFEHPKVEFEVCASCSTLLVETTPEYPWRLKLLRVIERKLKLGTTRKQAQDG